MTRGIDSPENYYYRRLITDCVRALDALASHLLQQIGKRKITGEICPEYQLVYKEANQLFHIYMVSPRNRYANHQIILPCITIEKNL